MDRTEKNLTIISIVISIISLGVAFYAIFVADKANDLVEEQNTISKKELEENIKSRELDIIRNYNDIFANMKITTELFPIFKLNKEKKYKEEDISALLIQLQGLIEYYEEGKITNKKIEENFDTIINFACYNIKGINITFTYPKIYKYCEENNYFN